MCGICGKVSFAGDDVGRPTLERMCAALVHRGPDDEGVYIAGRVGLAQRRLSIIDLSHDGVAPLSNEDGTIWVTFNGEIYNFPQLRAELSARGHIFRTRTDTETIVHLYEEHGVECLSRLKGMFALAIWDQKRQRLFAARDRLGKKPFFYVRTSAGLTFASSIKALLADSAVAAVPNYRALDDFLTYQYVPSPETAFTGIYKLPPGHYLTFERDTGLEVRRYWRPPLVTGPMKTRPDPLTIEAELLERLEAAVRARLIADVPLGAFLSGGVDSGAVVALMARASNRPVKTFSIGFEEQDFDELPAARLLADRYATEHHEFIVRPDATEVLPHLVRHYGEPFADPSAVPTYYLSKLTRGYVTVALSGDGGDENFAGYDNYQIVSAWGHANIVPGFARRAVRAGVAEVVERLPYHPLSARVDRASAMLASELSERFRLQSSVLKPEEKRALYSDRFRELLVGSGGESRCGPGALVADPNVEPLDWMTWHDLQFYLPDCLMVKVDVASMANSLEVRCPLLDHEFVEFTATIPAALKRNETGGKVIFKRALAQLLPAETLDRAKKGFGVPLRRWFRAELLDMTRGTLLDDRAQRRGLFHPSLVRQLVADHAAGRRDWSHRLWALVWLELWFREFVD
jgi:asparagine synthase (glutamine-hydrolysing)